MVRGLALLVPLQHIRQGSGPGPMPGAGVQRERPVPHLKDRGVHLQGPDRHSHHHKDRECGKAPECAAESLLSKRRGAGEGESSHVFQRNCLVG